ncbi:MAG: Bug family tripartite tricarboxylate transporter substrate binding protein [Beijerinckiaceae bacterium]
MNRQFIGAATGLFLAAASPSLAQDNLAPHYAGKTVRIVVGYPSGSGFDVYARAVARHMGKHIPGKPAVIVQNMPGAGGLTSVAYMANVAPRDGLTLALINPVNSTEPLLNPDMAKFDSTKFRWLGSVNKDVQTCVFWTQKAKSAEDMKKVELVLGATGPSSGSALDAKALQALLGFKFKIVMGYPGIADIRLAAEKGEVDGHCGMPLAQIKTDIWEGFTSGRIKALIQIATADYPELKGIPNAFDLARNEDDRKILNLVFAPWTYGRPLLAPPETPAATVAALRAAFDATMKDREFLAEAKQMNLDVNPLDGAAVEKLVRDLFATPKPLVERTRTILGVAGK